MWGGDLDGVDAGEFEGGVEGFHGGYEVGDEVLVVGVHDLVADEDGVDTGFGVEGGDVGGDPAAGGGELGERGDVAVGHRDGHANAGVSEGAEDVGVGVEDLDAVDGCLGLEEVGDLGRRREVVAEGAVVDADGEDGGEEEEEEEEEERRRWSSNSSGSHGFQAMNIGLEMVQCRYIFMKPEREGCVCTVPFQFNFLWFPAFLFFNHKGVNVVIGLLNLTIDSVNLPH